MNSTNGALDFQARIDIEQLRRDIDKMKAEFRGVTKTVSEEGNKAQQIINNMLKGATAYFTIQQARQFAGQIIAIRGEFQQLQVAFETMLRSKSKADKMMSDVVDFAAKTPFQLTEVAGGTKQLLAYRIEQEKIIPTLKALGDVSAGLSVPIGRLILNYGQVKTATKLTGRELRDFNIAGVPLIAELSKNLNKSETEIQAMVSAGKIGFKEVEDAFRTMTSEGGRFADLMDKQSGTITGRISNLKDNIDKMMNDIGQANEGVINDAISGAGYLVENYEEIGRILADLIAVYGSYRTALVLTSVAQGIATQSAMGYTFAEQIRYKWLLLVETAQKRLNLTMLKNPYILVGVAVGTLVYGLYKLATAQSEAEKAQERLNNRIKEQKEYIDNERNEVEKLIRVIKDEISTRTDKQLALDKLQSKYPNIFKNMDIEMIKNLKNADALKEVNKQLKERATLSDKEQISNNNKRIQELKKLRDVSTGTGSIYLLNQQIKALELDNEKLQKHLELKENAEEKARFNALSNSEKIRIKEGENQLLKNEISELEEKQKNNYIKDPMLEGKISSAKKQLQENQKNILKWSEKETKIIHDKNKLLSEQIELNKTIAKYQGKKGLTSEDDKQLSKAQERVKEIEKLLKAKFGYKKSSSSKSEKAIFDELELQRKQNRAIEDAKYESRINQIKIDKDGYEQERALMKAEHERKLVLIQRMEDDKLLELGKFADEAKKAGKSFDLTGQVEVWEQIFEKQRETENEAYNHNETKAQQEHLKDLLEQYKTYEQQKEDIRKKYAQQREDLKGQDYDKKKLDQAEASELFEIEKKAGKIKSTISLVFSDLSGKTRTELDKIRQQAEELYNFLSSGKWNADLGAKLGVDKETFVKLSADPKSLDALRKKIRELTSSSKSFSDNLSTLFKEDVGVEEFSQSLGAVDGEIQAGVQSLNMFSDALQSISDVSGNEMFGNIASGIKDITSLTSSAMQGAKTGMTLGGATGAIIGGGLGLITGIIGKIAGAEKRHREALKRIQQSNIQQQHIYNQLLFEQKILMKDAENIFGVDELAKAINYTKVYEDSFKKLQDKLTKKKGNWIVNTPFGKINTGLKTFESALDKIKIKTGHKKTGLFGWGRGKNVYSSITSKYKDLVKANGDLNVELAKSLLQSKDFGKGGKEALQEIITLYEQTEKANTELDNYLKSTFGELGRGMMDSIVKSLKTGEDAFESFGKSAGNVMLKLGKQMIFSATLKPILDQMQKQIKETVKQGKGLDTQNVAKNVANVISNSMGEIKSGLEVGKLGLDAWNKEIKSKMDVDIFNDQQRQATQKGFQGMSQDQASSLEGKFTLSNELERQHLTVAKEISGSFKFLQDISAKQLKHLAGIEKNTATLHDVKKDIGGVKSSLEEIRDKGIKMRR